MKSFILAPQYREEERKNAQFLCDYLRDEGAFYSFMDSEIVEAALIKDDYKYQMIHSDMTLLAEASLALDIYLMTKEADCCIGFLNGKDEAVILKLGIAYALGIPIYLYKNDPRVVFIAGENSMILGLSRHKPFKDLKKLRRKIKNFREKEQNQKINIRKGTANLYSRELSKIIGENLAEQIELGREVCERYYRKADKNLNTLIAFLREYKKDMKIRLEKVNDRQQQGSNEKSNSPCVLDGFRLFKDKAYCSGPLFSPDEQREMADIAAVMKKNGIGTYLPQRDGAEPYFFGTMGSPLSGMLIAKPISNIVHQIIFNIDIKEIIECKYFVLNLNGRYYDEGAMAEAGIAYALGKVIVIFHSDQREFFRRGLPPILSAITPLKRSVNEIGTLAEALQEAEALDFNECKAGKAGKESSCQTTILPANQLAKSYRSGEKALRLLRHIKKPKNHMLNWPG